MGSREQARRLIKHFTRHNDKLGFDFSNNYRKYKVNISQQFKSSEYDKFLAKAQQFYTAKG